MSLWTKARKKITNTAKDIGKGLKSAALDPLRATGKLFEAGYDVARGDFSEAGKDLASAAQKYTKGSVNLFMGGTTNKLATQAGNAVGATTSYGLLNFNQGSQYVEDLTGWDIDSSNAKAAEAAAKAAYEAEVKAANDAEARNRRANLLSLRKSLTPSLSRSSQGGAASNIIEKSQGGIILG